MVFSRVKSLLGQAKTVSSSDPAQSQAAALEQARPLGICLEQGGDVTAGGTSKVQQTAQSLPDSSDRTTVLGVPGGVRSQSLTRLQLKY
jgi:hypothetical protein